MTLPKLREMANEALASIKELKARRDSWTKEDRDRYNRLVLWHHRITVTIRRRENGSHPAG